MSTTLAEVGAATGSVRTRLGETLLVRGALRTPQGRIGLVLVGVVLGVALLGPLVSPGSSDAVVGLPFEKPSAAHWLGTEELGRDAFSRYLHGGLALVLVAFAASVVDVAAAVPPPPPLAMAQAPPLVSFSQRSCTR